MLRITRDGYAFKWTAARTVNQFKSISMKTYEFELILSEPPAEDLDDKIYEIFDGHVTIAVIAGTGRLAVYFEAPGMEGAIQDAIRRANAVGLRVDHVELDPAVLQAA